MTMTSAPRSRAALRQRPDERVTLLPSGAILAGTLAALSLAALSPAAAAAAATLLVITGLVIQHRPTAVPVLLGTTPSTSDAR
ncbi:hypothetical protein GA0111570_101371 [Raineyella antarctica]|uniref:Uncharacterized protein n=1 Tax=Raineyella antarctica TaxID=1577474 RepID=A0A1G6GFZ1_9ACTN|nr:hypothetical protein [Raineyella antarctica]SDB80096.1 hypothetical protein GA0111570_101371 [Raineyella antarctica]